MNQEPDQDFLNNEDLNYLNRKTKINQNKILDYYEKFIKKFPTGQINRSQFEALIKRMIIVNLEQGDIKSTDSSEIEKKKNEMCDRVWAICDQDEG